MELSNSFDVERPIEEAWVVLTDVERIAPCLPGAELQEIDGDEYHGIVKVKVGPITAQYKGVASFVEKNDADHRAVLNAKGRDTRGAGNASAVITAQLASIDAANTRVDVDTDMTITGKVAQFGRGVMADVSGKLMDQFAENLATMLSEGGSDGGDGSTRSAISGGAPEDVDAAQPAEVEAIDLLATAGAPVLKRLIPTLVVIAVIIVIIVLIVS